MKLEPGDRFTAEIASFVLGKATVNVDGDTITVGPLNCEPGETVHLKYLGEESINKNTTAGFAVCLDDSYHGEDHDEYIRHRVQDVLPDETPKRGEITYGEITEINERNLAVTELGGQRVHLGPVNARVSDLVQIEGVGDGYAKVLTESARGENYQIRFNILAGRTNAIPLSIGDEFTTVITHVANNQLSATVKGVPIVFPSGDAQKAQKVDGRITGFEKDQAVAEITETYEEVGRVSDTGEWAHLQWLQDAIYDEEPLRQLAMAFLNCSQDALPDRDKLVRDALIAETIRLALHEKPDFNTDSYPRVHITGLRHWVEHKLGPVLGWLDEVEEDWFRKLLTDRTGPTLTFLGDIIQLANGYYAPAPTRAIMTGDSEAVLISGAPTQHFQRDAFNLEIRGISRVLTDVTEADLQDAGIELQSLEEYIGSLAGAELTDGKLLAFCETRQRESWAPSGEWDAYVGERGYGFDWGEDPLTAVGADSSLLSLWRVPREYGAPDYRLKIAPDDGADPEMIAVPIKYRKQVCLALDALSGQQRRIEITPAGEDFRVSLNFAPTQAQMRWLNAIGAAYEQPKLNQLHWQFDPQDKESVLAAFRQLPVTIDDATTEESIQ